MRNRSAWVAVIMMLMSPLFAFAENGDGVIFSFQMNGNDQGDVVVGPEGAVVDFDVDFYVNSNVGIKVVYFNFLVEGTFVGGGPIDASMLKFTSTPVPSAIIGETTLSYHASSAFAGLSLDGAGVEQWGFSGGPGAPAGNFPTVVATYSLQTADIMLPGDSIVLTPGDSGHGLAYTTASTILDVDGVAPLTINFLAYEIVSADLDRDYDVDQSDFGLLQACLGASLTSQPACTAAAELGGVATVVNADDVAVYNACFSGAGVEVDITCDD